MTIKNRIMINKFTLFICIIYASTTFAQHREFYQLKVYTFDTEEQQNKTDIYLEKSYLPALKKLNISNIGVFKPRDVDSLELHKTYVLIPFQSLLQFESLDSLILIDDVYLKNANSYLESTFDNAPYKRVTSILLKAFEDHPKLTPTSLKGPREDRIYELRSYESATYNLYMNKVDMFNEGGEVTLFNKLEFNAVFYGEVISGASMPNLMYMTSFDNQVSRDEHWKKFVESPEWNELKAIQKYQNNVSHIDITFLYPTPYSEY